MGFFPPLPLPFFQVQIRATAAGSERVSLLGRQSRAAVDGGKKQEAAPHSAPLCAPTGGAAVTGISRVIAVQAQIRGQLRS